MRVRAIDLVDVLVYLVVLSLFVQFFPEVLSESFLVSLVTAILLKLALEVVMWAKKRLVASRKSAESRLGKLIPTLTLVLLMPGSKFLVLWLTDLVLGGQVRLGGFWLVTVLILALMLSRGLVRRFLVPEDRPSV